MFSSQCYADILQEMFSHSYANIVKAQPNMRFLGGGGVQSARTLFNPLF